MRLRGRLWLVAVVVCLGLVPARSEAAVITVDGTLSASGDIFFQPFIIDGPSLLNVNIQTGFFPVLTLFEADDSIPPEFEHDALGYRYLTEFQSFTDDIILDEPFELNAPAGSRYLLALSQQPYLFSPATGTFDTPDADTLEALEECGGFLNAANECGTGNFAGSFSVEAAAVPEPATVSLVALGAATLALRRRRERGQG
jgi:hypothetical protein